MFEGQNWKKWLNLLVKIERIGQYETQKVIYKTFKLP